MSKNKISNELTMMQVMSIDHYLKQLECSLHRSNFSIKFAKAASLIDIDKTWRFIIDDQKHSWGWRYRKLVEDETDIKLSVSIIDGIDEAIKVININHDFNMINESLYDHIMDWGETIDNPSVVDYFTIDIDSTLKIYYEMFKHAIELFGTTIQETSNATSSWIDLYKDI